MVRSLLDLLSGTDQTQDILHGTLIVVTGLMDIVHKCLGLAVNAEDGRHTQIVGLAGALVNAADDGDQRHILSAGALGDAGDNLAVDALRVDAALTGDDHVIGAEKAEEGKTLLTVTVNGYGKRTELSEYLRTGAEGEKVAQSRGGKGLKNYNITPKTGRVAGCRVVSETDDVMLIENGGVIIRVPASSINIYKRDVQGVIIMRIEEGNSLVSIERVENEESED